MRTETPPPDAAASAPGGRGVEHQPPPPPAQVAAVHVGVESGAEGEAAGGSNGPEIVDDGEAPGMPNISHDDSIETMATKGAAPTDNNMMVNELTPPAPLNLVDNKSKVAAGRDGVGLDYIGLLEVTESMMQRWAQESVNRQRHGKEPVEHIQGGLETIEDEDGAPHPGAYHCEGRKTIAGKSDAPGAQRQEIFNDESDAPIDVEAPPGDHTATIPPHDSGVNELSAAEKAELVFRYMLWILLAIPPPDPSDNPTDVNRRPSAIAARPPPPTTSFERSSNQELFSNGSGLLRNADGTPMVEATLVDAEVLHDVHITYQPAPAGPVYDAVQIEDRPIPCWKRYRRSACVARSMFFLVLGVSLAVPLSNTRKPSSETNATEPQLSQPPQTPTCTDTPGYFDKYGRVCDEYKAADKYPWWCLNFGNDGEAGDAPNENCCVCKEIASTADDDSLSTGPSAEVMLPPTIQRSLPPSKQPALSTFGLSTSPVRGEADIETLPNPASSDSTPSPSGRPTDEPTYMPTPSPSPESPSPTIIVTTKPTQFPTSDPTTMATNDPTKSPVTPNPTRMPTSDPTKMVTNAPTKRPTLVPSASPSVKPTPQPTRRPTSWPSKRPTHSPTRIPTDDPTAMATNDPTKSPVTPNPTRIPTSDPTKMETNAPTKRPTLVPSASPSMKPTPQPGQTSVLELVAREGIVAPDAKFQRNEVAVFGNTAIVGAHSNDNKRGAAFVFVRGENGAWVEQAKLLAPEGADGDHFGVSVGLYGDTAVIGAPFDDDNGRDSGSVHIFVWDGVMWAHQAKILEPNGAARNGFGRFLAIWGDTVVVGAPGVNPGETSFPGRAHVFVRSGGAWSAQAELIVPGLAGYDWLGYGVDIHGDSIVAGTYGDDDNGSKSGSAHIFVRNGSDWMHESKLLAPDGAALDRFGGSVGIYGDTAVVGHAGSGNERPSAYIFVRDGTTWTHQEKLLAPNGMTGQFGRSVGIFGDMVVVAGKGSCHVFIRSGATMWAHQTKLLPPDTAVTEFGSDVAIHGNNLVVGSQTGAYISPLRTPSASSSFLRTADSSLPTSDPTTMATNDPTKSPVTPNPTRMPTSDPTIMVTNAPTKRPTLVPSASPSTQRPTNWPTKMPTPIPTRFPTSEPVASSAASQISQSTAVKLVPSEAIAEHDAEQYIAIHGNAAVVGAPYNDDKKGAVFVFVKGANGEWSQQSKLVAPDGYIDDRFGNSVGIFGDTIVAGAPLDDDNGQDSGSAHVFVRNGADWSHQAKLLAPDGAAGDFFGVSVAINQDTIVVGAYQGEASGSTHVFVRNGADWSHQAKLLAPDAAAGDYFGQSVAIYQDTIVGTDWDDDNGEESGSAHVFVRSGANWSHQAKLLAPDGAAIDVFGWSVAIYQDTIVVGAPGDDDNGDWSGSVHVFVRNAVDWVHQAKILPPDGAAGGNFGGSVAIHGNLIIVSAHLDDDSGENSGSAHVFVREGANWNHQAKLVAPDGASQDYFGLSLAIDNGTALVGSKTSAYVFSD